MRQVGDNQFEITNRSTGEKKVVSGEELSSYGLQKPLSTAAKIQQTIYKVPVIGDIAQVVGASATGLIGKFKTGQVEKETMAKQDEARKLAIAARNELDPETKKKMLDESRRLSQEAGQRASEYSEALDSAMPEWAKNKESPTKNDVKEMLVAYGIPSARAGIAAGELLALGTGIPTLGPQGSGFWNALARVGANTAGGAVVGGTQGFLEGDDKSIEERTQQAKTGATIGGITAGTLSTAGEVVSALRNFNKTKAATELASKVNDIQDKTSIDKKIWNKITEEAKKSNATISNKEIVDKMTEYTKKTLGESGSDYNKVMKLISQEDPSKIYNISQATNIKSKLPFSTSTKATTAFFRNAKRQAIKDLIAEKAPTVGDLNKLYALSKSVQNSKLVKKIIGGGVIVGGAKLLGLDKLLIRD